MTKNVGTDEFHVITHQILYFGVQCLIIYHLENSTCLAWFILFYILHKNRINRMHISGIYIKSR